MMDEWYIPKPKPNNCRVYIHESLSIPYMYCRVVELFQRQ